jgi:DNA-binding GntR family transcriptional regulator
MAASGDVNTKRDTGLSTIGYTARPAASRRARTGSARPDVGLAVHRRLRDLIVTGRLGPGAPLIEADLAKRLAASRTPVRAALRRLRQEGFVSPSPVGQALRPIVAPLTASDLAEVFLMVGAFEAAAARAAARLTPTRRASLVAELTADVGALGGVGQSHPPDLSASHARDGRFHRILADAGAGPRLRGELDVLYLQAARYVRAYGQATPRAVARARAEHLAIARALATGNGNLAGRRVAAHWRQSMERLQPAVGMIGEQGTW